MRIVLGVHHFPPTYTAGAELEAYRIARHLQARGHEIQVICVERIDDAAASLHWQDDLYDGIPVRRLFFNLHHADDPFLYSYDNPWIGDHLRTLFQTFQPHLFHLISGYLLSGRAIHVAQDQQIPVVVSLMDFWFLCPRITMMRSNGHLSTFPINATTCARCLGEERRRFRLPGHYFPKAMNWYWQHQPQATAQVEQRQQFLRHTLNQAQAIICRSHFFQNVFTEAGIDTEKLIFSRQGWDLPAAASGKTATTHLRIAYIGQIAHHKGVHLLFDAARNLPHANFTVTAYGDKNRFPEYAAALQQQIAPDPRFRLAGAYQAHQISQIFQEIDLLVVPSLWYENSPNVIVEAFAHQTPIVVSDMGAMPELVQDGVNGLLFTMGDAAALTRQLQRFFDEPTLLQQLSAGIGPIKTVSEEIDELEAIYHRLQPEKTN